MQMSSQSLHGEQMRRETTDVIKTLLLTLVFAPDGVSTATLLGDLVDGLSSLGHDVTVVTTTPHYNEDESAAASHPLRRKWGGILYESRRGSVRVYHARMRKKGRRILGRLLDHAIFHVLGTIAAMRLVTKYDVVLAPSPPLTIGLQAALLAWMRGARFIYNVQEMFPDIAVRLGLVKNRFAIRILEAIERFIYRRASKIVVISDRFQQRLLEKGVPQSKLRVIPNFVDTEFIRPLPQVNAFSTSHGLEGRFVVLYAGNVGLTQDFESILSAAELLSDLPDVVFLIVGDGARYRWLEARVAEELSRNVRLLPYQPRAVVPDLYAASSIGLVTLRKGTAHETFPSKIYTIMAAERAAIVMADPDSELTDVVLRAGCGVALPAERPQQLADTIRRMHADRQQLNECARAGRQFVIRFHSIQAAADQYDQVLREVANFDGRT